MIFGEIIDRFVEESAASVMFRGTLENVVTAELLDEVFVNTAKRQRCGEFLFSAVVDLLALVATGSRKSVNDAYRAKKKQFRVSVASVYKKTQWCGDGGFSADAPPNRVEDDGSGPAAGTAA